MGKLHQIEVRYDAREDRLWLRIGADDGRDYAFWLTRRMVRGFLGLSERALRAAAAGRTAAATDPRAAADALLAFEQEAAAAQPWQPAPPGDGRPRPEARLVQRIMIARDPVVPDRLKLRLLGPPDEPAVAVAVPAAFLHRLRAGLVEAMGRSGWDLAVPPAVAADTAPTEPRH